MGRMPKRLKLSFTIHGVERLEIIPIFNLIKLGDDLANAQYVIIQAFIGLR